MKLVVLIAPLALMLALPLICDANAGVTQPQDSDTRKPSAGPDQILKRFVEECVEITPGKGRFPQGLPRPDNDGPADAKSRSVKELPVEFRISKYETTQELYELIAGVNPSRWPGPRNSVERVNFRQVQEFCNLLTKKLRSRNLISADQVVRLPTSSEWEYCCRAGSRTRFCFGDAPGEDGGTTVLNEYAWHTGNAAGNDPAVGVLKPNEWQLFDMHGYLWEFVDDPEEHQVPGSATVRGGSWRDRHPLLSSASYLSISESESGDHIGFRCVIAKKGAAKITSRR